MSDGGNLFVFLEVILLVFLNSSVLFFLLLLKVLYLTLIRVVLGEFDVGETLFELPDLSLESLDGLLLHANFSFRLSSVALLVLFKISEVALQDLDFKVLFASLFSDARFKLFLLRNDSSVASVLLFVNPLLTLLCLHLVEVLHLRQLLLVPLNHLLDLGLALFLLFSELLLKVGFSLSHQIIHLLTELLLGSLEGLHSFEQVVAGVDDVLCGLIGLTQLALEVVTVELVLMLEVAQSLLQVIILCFEFLNLG